MSEAAERPFWRVYVLWRDTGKREAVRTQHPQVIGSVQHCEVLARVVEPRVTVQPRQTWRETE